MRSDQRVPQSVLPCPDRRCRRGDVLQLDPQPQRLVRPGHSLSVQPHPRGQRLPLTDETAGPAGQLRDGHAAVNGELDVAVTLEQRGHDGCHLLLVLNSFVEGRVLSPRYRQRMHVAPFAAGLSLDEAPLHLQEPDSHVDLSVVSAIEQALGLRPAGLCRVHRRPAGRHQDAELEPHLILLGSLVIRVQQIALVQDRVGDLPGVLEIPRRHGGPPARSAASASRACIVASHVGRPLAILNRSSSSNVAVLSRSQALLGK